MNWQGKRVLVTGAGGFIGSHLTERLVTLGAQTRALVHYRSDDSWGWLDHSRYRDDMEVVAGDICDRDSVLQALADREIVFHLSALIAIPYSYHAPQSYVRTNIEGTVNVLQAARQSGVQRLVHTSTSEVYGTARYVPIDEGHPLQGQSPYSASKIGADKLVEAFHLSFQVPVTTVRPFNTYGPRQSSRAVIPTIITQALTQPQVQLGNLQSTRDFNYVEDTVSGFVNAAESEAALGQVLNLGSGRETSIGELAKLILELTGKSDLPIVTDAARLRPEASEVDRLCADPSQAQAKLGWQSAHTLEEGLLATIDWVRSNLESYRIGTYTI